jgi:DNA-binding transcriptional LysR family regulator
MDRLEDLRLFVQVAESRSFSRAAEKLNLSKSVASRRLADLEERLGVRLLNRTTRSISLTQAGQGFFQRVGPILAELAEAEMAVTSEVTAPRGVLKLAVPMSFGIRHLGPAITMFMERWPDVEVSMDVSDRFVDLVEEGYDVALRIGQLKDSSLIARRICPIRMVVCASPAYLKARGVPQTPDDLQNHDHLVYSGRSQPGLLPFRVAPGSDELRMVRVQGRLCINNGDLLREAARAGMGIIDQPTFIVGDDLLSGALQPVLLDYVPTLGAMHCVYPANRHLSPKVRAFVDFIAGRFGPVPYWDASLTMVKGG